LLLQASKEGGEIVVNATSNNLEPSTNGPGSIAAVGNGNAASIEPFQAGHRKAFNGLCMLIVKSKKGEKGTIKIEAFSENLTSAETALNTK